MNREKERKFRSSEFRLMAVVGHPLKRPVSRERAVLDGARFIYKYRGNVNGNIREWLRWGLKRRRIAIKDERLIETSTMRGKLRMRK